MNVNHVFGRDYRHVPQAPIGIIATPGGRELAETIDKELIKERLSLLDGYPPYENYPGFLRDTFIIDSDAPRFQNGEGKAVINLSVRGLDLFFITDIGNWGIKYSRNGETVSMAPDEHFQDLKRLVAAARGMGHRCNVIMPMLYESRQHRISGRESLDCAIALQELVNLGVNNIMTIDAHNAHVHNAIPNHGFENLHAAYQIIKKMVNTIPDFRIGPDNLIVVSPDLGGMSRCRYFAEQLHTHLTGFYKLRDLSRVVDGKAPVLEHKFLGGSIAGRDAIVVDDMIASGGSVIEVAYKLKEAGVRNIYVACTFMLFTSGLEKFNKAYEEGVITKVFGTNATYTRPDLLQAPWYTQVSVSRLISLYIDLFNRNESIAKLLDNSAKISKLLETHDLHA
ncbi:ribose-phosphate diphosphokinase [bacterium]|nr:ribose-phosphate diphosphokinase [bacterium]